MPPPATSKTPLVSKCQKCSEKSKTPERPKLPEKPKSPEKPECEQTFERSHEQILSTIRSRVETSYDARLDWVKPYLDEERLGTANLQRQRRLIEEQKAKSHSDDDNLSEYTIVSPDTETEPEDLLDPDLEEELIKLREKYWEHQIRLNSLIETRPIDVGTVDEVLLLRSHRDQHNRTFAWKMEREKCAASGGCCGRTCGCCERALAKYLEPVKDGEEEGERKEVQVLGHCTVECGCCILVRGCYTPHPGLPPVDGDR